MPVIKSGDGGVEEKSGRGGGARRGVGMFIVPVVPVVNLMGMGSCL